MQKALLRTRSLAETIRELGKTYSVINRIGKSTRKLALFYLEIIIFQFDRIRFIIMNCHYEILSIIAFFILSTVSIAFELDWKFLWASIKSTSSTVTSTFDCSIAPVCKDPKPP